MVIQIKVWCLSWLLTIFCMTDSLRLCRPRGQRQTGRGGGRYRIFDTRLAYCRCSPRDLWYKLVEMWKNEVINSAKCELNFWIEWKAVERVRERRCDQMGFINNYRKAVAKFSSSPHNVELVGNLCGPKNFSRAAAVADPNPTHTLPSTTIIQKSIEWVEEWIVWGLDWILVSGCCAFIHAFIESLIWLLSGSSKGCR